MNAIAADLSPQGARLRHFVDLEPETGDFLADTLEGLCRRPKSLSPKYFYDEKGSKLFDAICELPEYYVTRTEIDLLDRLAPEFRKLAGPDAHVIEFGSGSSIKIRTLLDGLDQPKSYVALDISRDHLLRAAEAIAHDYPQVETSAICADFTQDFAWPQELTPEHGGRLVGFLPGSTIGNLTAREAVSFLRTIRKTLGSGGALLIGVDLLKDPEVLKAAYDDAQGVTAAFNKNILFRLRNELDADLSTDGFRHEARFNTELERIEMHLVAEHDQTISLAGQRFALQQGESIHTENSHKYSLSGFQALSRQAGFSPTASWTDQQQLFSLHWLDAV